MNKPIVPYSPDSSSVPHFQPDTAQSLDKPPVDSGKVKKNFLTNTGRVAGGVLILTLGVATSPALLLVGIGLGAKISLSKKSRAALASKLKHEGHKENEKLPSRLTAFKETVKAISSVLIVAGINLIEEGVKSEKNQKQQEVSYLAEKTLRKQSAQREASTEIASTASPIEPTTLTDEQTTSAHPMPVAVPTENPIETTTLPDEPTPSKIEPPMRTIERTAEEIEHTNQLLTQLSNCFENSFDLQNETFSSPEEKEQKLIATITTQKTTSPFKQTENGEDPRVIYNQLLTELKKSDEITYKQIVENRSANNKLINLFNNIVDTTIRLGGKFKGQKQNENFEMQTTEYKLNFLKNQILSNKDMLKRMATKENKFDRHGYKDRLLANLNVLKAYDPETYDAIFPAKEIIAQNTEKNIAETNATLEEIIKVFKPDYKVTNQASTSQLIQELIFLKKKGDLESSFHSEIIRGMSGALKLQNLEIYEKIFGKDDHYRTVNEIVIKMNILANSLVKTAPKDKKFRAIEGELNQSMAELQQSKAVINDAVARLHPNELQEKLPQIKYHQKQFQALANELFHLDAEIYQELFGDTEPHASLLDSSLTSLETGQTNLSEAESKRIKDKKAKHRIAAARIDRDDFSAYRNVEKVESVKQYLKIGTEEVLASSKVEQGPLNKSQETQDAELILKHLLKDFDAVTFEERGDHCFATLTIDGQEREFDLKELLANVDFNQIQFTEEELKQYEKLIMSPRSLSKPYVQFYGSQITSNDDFDNIEAGFAEKERIGDKLTFAEKIAINIYTGEAYGQINWLLRTGHLSEQPEAMKINFLHAAVAVHGLNRLPDFEPSNGKAYLYRVESENKQVVAKRVEAVETGGRPIMETGFFSTTQGDSSFMKMDKNRVGIIVKNVKGKNVRTISTRASENEVLLPPTPLQWRGHKQYGTNHVFYAKPVSTPTSSSYDDTILD